MALSAGIMPPMPSPVTTRQIDSVTRSPLPVTMAMPSAMTARQPSTVRRRPMRSANPPTQHRSDHHADQFHRQHDAEGGAVNAPFAGNAGRGKADREHVEAVERAQRDGDGDDGDLRWPHRVRRQQLSWILLRHKTAPTRPRDTGLGAEGSLGRGRPRVYGLRPSPRNYQVAQSRNCAL